MCKIHAFFSKWPNHSRQAQMPALTASPRRQPHLTSGSASAAARAWQLLTLWGRSPGVPRLTALTPGSHALLPYLPLRIPWAWSPQCHRHRAPGDVLCAVLPSSTQAGTLQGPCFPDLRDSPSRSPLELRAQSLSAQRTFPNTKPGPPTRPASGITVSPSVPLITVSDFHTYLFCASISSSLKWEGRFTALTSEDLFTKTKHMTPKSEGETFI